ncbi:MAG TPA: hypothetical protein VGM64_17950 [Lacunisphaera sp.]|jgi:hypothetical protein
MQKVKSHHLFFVVIASVVLLSTGCGSEILSRDEKSVKVYKSVSAIPHGYDSYRIVIAGKSYSDVYGGIYLEIPEKNLICFRTESRIGASYLHVVPTRSDFKEFKVKLEEDSSFGHSLGMEKNDVVSTYVDKIEGDEILFTEHFWKRGQNRYRLNLKLHTLEQIEKGEHNGPADKS